MRAKITAVGVAGILSALASSASAQADPGFTADPHSPAGVEYAIPLDTARGHGGGGGGGGGGGHQSGPVAGSSGSGGGGQTGGGAGGGSSPALFGAGITPPSRAKAKHGAAGSGAKGGSRAKAVAKPSGASGVRAAAPIVASASYSSTGPVAGIVGAILLAGALLGLFLRRRGDSRRTIS